MLFKNHIVNRLLKDKTLIAEMAQTQYQRAVQQFGKDKVNFSDFDAFIEMLLPDGNKNFYISKTVLGQLDLFDTKKALQFEGWKIFENMKDCKYTFILDDNICIRMVKRGGRLHFTHLQFTLDAGSKDYGQAYWIMFWIDLNTGELCEHFTHPDTERTAPFIFALLCFIELCDIESVYLIPGAKHGTRKQGKIINTLGEPLTIVNSKWNITTIRTEGFPVSGHIRLQRVGVGLSQVRMVYIEPYEKKGYIRKAGKELNQ